MSHEAAVLVPEGDVRVLGEALADLVAHPERWPAMSRAGRAHVALRYELGGRVADLEAQWRALASKSPLPAVPPRQ